MAGPASHGRSADRQQANSSSGDANNCAGNLGRSDSLVQHECQAGPPGAQPVSPFGEKDRLEDTWATTPGKTPERHSTGRIWSAIFSRGQSSYHSQHLLLWSGDQGVGVSHLARCPPGQAPRWGNHIPAMHDCQGGTQAGLGTAAQSLSGKVPGRFWKGVTSPGDFPDACPCSNTGGSSPVPPCSSVFTIPSETQPIRTRR